MWRLLSLVALLACDDGGTDPIVDAGPDAMPQIQVALALEADQAQVALGVWGSGPDNVWFVGGDAASRAVWHHDGQLNVVDVPAGPMLWWVFGDEAGTLWVCGEEGQLLSRATDGAWTTHDTGLEEKAVLWGVWGRSDDLWAVGGSVRRGGPKSIVLRYDGAAWRRVEDPLFPAELNFYKVWGTGPEDLFIVGEGGVVMHWDGASFTRSDTAVKDLLFTVHGREGGPVLAVGGLAEGRVLRFDGRDWVEDGPAGISGLNGVFVHADGTATATGNRGLLLRRDTGGAWTRLVTEGSPLGRRTVHAVWGPDRWLAGGDLQGLRDGVIGRIQ